MSGTCEFKWDGSLSVPDADRAFDRILGYSSSSDYGYRAVELRDSGLVAGQIGLFPSQNQTVTEMAYRSTSRIGA